MMNDQTYRTLPTTLTGDWIKKRRKGGDQGTCNPLLPASWSKVEPTLLCSDLTVAFSIDVQTEQADLNICRMQFSSNNLRTEQLRPHLITHSVEQI
jgi:hypothetical protein